MTIVVFYFGVIIQSLSFPISPEQCDALVMDQQPRIFERWQDQDFDINRLEIDCVEPGALVVLSGGDPA